jgi:uncharacterized protein
MIPNDPEHSPETAPILIPEIPVPARKQPFWDYVDLFFVISLCLPALFIAALLVKGLSGLLPGGRPLQGLIGQLIAYGLIFGSLYAVLHFRYRQPFWRSLGWKVQPLPMIACLFAGPPLALAIGWLGYILRAPVIETPFEEMLRDRTTLIVFSVFVVVIGPLCEELAFRGFMMPLLMRSFGALPGIVLTGALFGSLHGPEYSWSWQHVLLVGLAGTVFGWVRYKTGSTAAATFMHSTYNLMQLAAFLIQTSTR